MRIEDLVYWCKANVGLSNSMLGDLLGYGHSSVAGWNEETYSPETVKKHKRDIVKVVNERRDEIVNEWLKVKRQMEEDEEI